jgi:hypothetical protein
MPVVRWGVTPLRSVVVASVPFFTGRNGSGLVQECLRAGCVTPTTFVSGQNPKGFATSDAGLFWIDYVEQGVRNAIAFVDGGVMSCPLDGCDAGPTTLAWGQNRPSSLVVSGTTVYWAQGSSVMACDVTGCNGAPSTIASLPPGYSGAGAIAVDATDVYLGGTASPGDSSWTLWKCGRGGCPSGPTEMASVANASGNAAEEIAIDAARVYFVSGDGLQILALDK